MIGEIITGAGLLAGWLGGNKKKNELKKVDEANRLAKIQYNTKNAARNDALDAEKTSVSNQTAAQQAEVRKGRSVLAQALLKTLKPNTINAELASAGTDQIGNIKPITYTAPPPNVVAPTDMVVDPNTGNIYDALSKVLGVTGQAAIESDVANRLNVERGGTSQGLWDRLSGKKPKVRTPVDFSKTEA